jgi:hypothetical protein
MYSLRTLRFLRSVRAQTAFALDIYEMTSGCQTKVTLTWNSFSTSFIRALSTTNRIT